MFAYIGWRLLHGEMPYVQVWDHKPPVIFLIDALGLALGGGSWWGIWALELVFTGLAAAFCLRILRRAFGDAPAYVGVALFLLTLRILLYGGNFTEEYALPLQFASR